MTGTFSISSSTEETRLKCALGEVLGIHGWNDEQDILDFCTWHGVDPNHLITIPFPGGEGQMHTRTIFQALKQQIDLFGESSKLFNTDLAPHTTKPVGKLALLFIGCLSTFKKLYEKVTATFADILQ